MRPSGDDRLYRPVPSGGRSSSRRSESDAADRFVVELTGGSSQVTIVESDA